MTSSHIGTLVWAIFTNENVLTGVALNESMAKVIINELNTFYKEHQPFTIKKMVMEPIYE